MGLVPMTQSGNGDHEADWGCMVALRADVIPRFRRRRRDDILALIIRLQAPLALA